MPDDDLPDVALDLSPGDYIYQSDQEIFLVVTAVNEDSYEFAVHGWREIADYRLQEYLDSEGGTLHRQDTVKQVVEEEKDSETAKQFDYMTDLFAEYADGLSDEGPHKEFGLVDSDES